MVRKLMLSFGLLSIAIISSGCSTTPHSCELSEFDGKCASVTEAYEASFSGNDYELSVFGDEHSSDEKNSEIRVVEKIKVEERGFPAAGERGTPIYTPSKPYKFWVAPMRDAQNNLLGVNTCILRLKASGTLAQ